MLGELRTLITKVNTLPKMQVAEKSIIRDGQKPTQISSLRLNQGLELEIEINAKIKSTLDEL
jgi:ABC-type uncharacterized transport system ATPase subunit